MADITPAQAWRDLRDGNDRFVSGTPAHPSQGIEDRTRLTQGQHPKAILFGCSDSRVAAEIIFDQGLGDLFVVRTAGQAIDSAVLGSIDFAVAVLGVPLIVVLGHDSCGAVGATIKALDTNELPGGHIRDVVEKVTPSILLGRSEGLTETADFEAKHVSETAARLLERSSIVSDGVESGKVGIVGLTYSLSEGKTYLRQAIGEVDDAPDGAHAVAASS